MTHSQTPWNHIIAENVMVIRGNRISNLSSNPGRANIPLHVNALGKGINPSVLNHLTKYNELDSLALVWQPV